MPTHRFPVFLAIVISSGCSDLTGLFGGVELRVSVAPEAILPLDSGTVRITVYNRSLYAVSFDNSGCGISYEIQPTNRLAGPLRARCTPGPYRFQEQGPEFAVSVDGRVELAPGDSVTVDRTWRGRDWAGVWLAAGEYRIRGALVTEDYTRRGDEARPVTVLPWAPVRLVHSVGGADAIDLVVAGRAVVRGLPPGAITTAVPVAAGPQQAELRRSDDGASLGRFTLALAAGRARVLAVRRTDGSREIVDVTDSALVTAEDETRLRVIHLAEMAPAIEVYHTRPGDAASLPIGSPFTYGSASPYLRGGVGAWTIVAVTVGGADTLLATAPLPIAGGATRTIVLVDRPGGGIWATLVEPLPEPDPPETADPFRRADPAR
jgi:hypothetical protein